MTRGTGRSCGVDRAWQEVRRNGGASGINRVSLVAVEEYGVSRLLDELAAELREGRYRPLPARRVFIPKPGTTEQRPLSIPAVRNRIVQSAVKIALEPVFEADFLPCQLRVRRGARRTTPCRCSSMSPGRAAAGWWKPTSRAVLSRFHTAS